MTLDGLTGWLKLTIHRFFQGGKSSTGKKKVPGFYFLSIFSPNRKQQGNSYIYSSNQPGRPIQRHVTFGTNRNKRGKVCIKMGDGRDERSRLYYKTVYDHRNKPWLMKINVTDFVLPDRREYLMSPTDSKTAKTRYFRSCISRETIKIYFTSILSTYITPSIDFGISSCTESFLHDFFEKESPGSFENRTRLIY